MAKIDVEGNELRILRGMGRHMSRDDVKIICEYNPRLFAISGHSPHLLLDEFDKHSYKALAITEQDCEVRQLNDPIIKQALVKTGSVNLFCEPR